VHFAYGKERQTMSNGDNNELSSKNISESGVYIETMARVPSFYMPYQHTHSAIEIYYLKKGQCTYIINDSYVSVSAGDLIIIPPEVRHSTSYNGRDVSERVVVFAEPEIIPDYFYKKIPAIIEYISKPNKITMNKLSHARLEEMLRKISHEQTHPGKYSDVMESLYICELMTLIASFGTIAQDVYIPEKIIDINIEKAVHIIDTQYNKPLTLEDIASDLMLTPAYFSYKFHKVTGFTFKVYLNNVRMRNAMNMLRTTDDSITKIALACGFNSSNYFKDVFKLYNGCSPRDYKKRTSINSKFGSGVTME